MIEARLPIGPEDLLGPPHGGDLDMRPALLRVLTDLYLQRTTHTPEDEHYYTELALRLIEGTDVRTRILLAERLATYPSAPRAVLERLARDVIDVAAPILRHSSLLTVADRREIARACGEAHAETVAAVPRTSRTGDGRFTPALAGADAVELARLFEEAQPPERRLILLNLDYSIIPPANPAIAIQPADIARLERAVLQHHVTRELERALAITRGRAQRIVADRLGEPIVVAARALILPTDVLRRMLLFIHPGPSARRVHKLAELCAEVSIEAARRLVAIWREADRTEQSVPARPTPAWRTAAENARRALAEVSRRAQRRDAGILMRRGGDQS